MSFNKSESKSSSQERFDQHSTSNKSGSRATTDQMSRGPWAEQQPYLQEVFGGAQDIFNQSQGANQYTQDAFNRVARDGYYRLDNTYSQEQAMADNWDQLRQQQQGATQRYNQVVDEVLRQGMGDFQQQASDFAGDNPYLDQAVNQSWGNAQDMLDRQVGGAGGINHSASQGGNMASSRAGVAEGLATAEMTDAAQQNELALRQQAYDQGLNQANRVHEGRMGMASTMEQTAGDMARLLAGQQAAQQGYQQMAGQAHDMITANSLGAEQAHWNPIQNYMNLVGQRNWGQEGSSTRNTEYQEEGSGRDWGTGSSEGSREQSGFGFKLSNFIKKPTGGD
jgi:hypothetical protein